MDRQKSVPGKKGKGRAQAAPLGELIALGKSAAQEKVDLKRASSPQPMGRSKLMGPGSKREGPPLAGTSLLAKKPKMGSHTFAPLSRSPLESDRRGSPAPYSQAQPQPMAFEEAAVDVDPSELVSKALSASIEGDEDRVEGLICGAVKHLRNNRSKPDHIVYLSLMYLSKAQPSFFLSDIVIEAFCSVLKRDVANNFKAKGNPLVSVLACNVLMAAFAKSEDNWPESFVKVYIDDLLGEKVWVDREDCKPFVDNILTAFPTNKSPKQLLATIEGSATPFSFPSGGDEASKSSDGGDSEKSSGAPVVSNDFAVVKRYSNQTSSIQNYVMNVINNHMNKRQPMDVSTRSLIRLMAITAGYQEVRLEAARKLELWLQNPKLLKSGHELLLAVCCNCSVENPGDNEVILLLLKLRHKSKQNSNLYIQCIREMLQQMPDNVKVVVKNTLMNELSSCRNPNNMSLLNSCFNYAPEASSKVLAEVFQDLLANKDDYLRALRGLLKETIRNTRQDINLKVFCKALTKERLEPKFLDMEHKERFVISVSDLISMSMLLAITSGVKEAATRSDPREREPLHKFRNQIAEMQHAAICWLYLTVPKMFGIKGWEYVHCVRKVLYLEASEHYAKDNWPPENERNFMLRLVYDVPVLEDTLHQVVQIGLKRELPLMPQDCLDIIDNLVRRTASLHLDGMAVLQMTNLDMFSGLFKLSTYRHPDSIVLPTGYTAPRLAISNSYWKSWLVLLVLSAFNPTTYGKEGWRNYPTLKCLMEMMITNNYTFPPPTFTIKDKSVEQARRDEAKAREKEVPSILEFESHLAGGTITSLTSHLVHQLISLDPQGVAREPPQNVQDSFSQFNSSYKIGQLLCRGRDPNFLEEIIERQGTSKSMSWLADLVEANEGSINLLPVQCLCEFLLHDPREQTLTDLGNEESNNMERYRLRMRIQKHGQLLSQLQELVHGDADNTPTVFNVLKYFLLRLASNQAATRQQAIKGLSMVITDRGSSEEAMEVDGERSHVERNSHDWLLKHLPTIPMFPNVKVLLCTSIRQAIQVETDPGLVNSYIIFLSEHAMDQSLSILDGLVVDVSQLIVERNSVMNHILPDMLAEDDSSEYDRSLEAFLRIFYSYVSQARCKEKSEYSWSNNQDHIMLHWSSGQEATMHILVVHAMVIILSYGLPRDYPVQMIYQNLLEIWFPSNQPPPTAFLIDTSEEALLLPDWLKLRMIRSPEPRLVEAALNELSENQMLLFVQSFGIPVKSMSHLLMHLDAAAETNPSSLMKSVQDMNDPSYISRLILIQRMRGAQGGDRFYSVVTEGRTIPAVLGETSMEVDRQAPPAFHVRPPVKTETLVSAASVTSDFFKMFSTETEPRERVKLLQQLLKVLTTDGSNAAALLQAIAQRLESNEGKQFAQQLMKQPASSCPLFKIIITKHPALHPSLAPVLQAVKDKSGPGSTSSLSSLISQFLKTQTQHKPLSRKRQASIDLDSLKSQGAISPQAFIQGVEGMSDPNRLEAVVKQLMQESLQQKRASEGITMACTMLKESAPQGPSSFARESLLTDWLELLDPEIINGDMDLQEELVFGAKRALHSAGSGKGQKRKMPYLLALLTHQSLWSTLRRCLHRILRPEKLSLLDPTNVLDFVWACRHSPKIWQGRELKKTQDDISEDIFEFTTDQLLAIVDFIILEASQNQGQTSSKIYSADLNAHSSSAAGQSTAKRDGKEEGKRVVSRLELLLACVCEREDRIQSIVTHIQQRAPLVTRVEEDCYLELLSELYLHFPYILDWLPPSVSNSFMGPGLIHAKLDTVTHRLIGVLGKAGPSKQADIRMKDANTACRKLASRHPMLILRQLPLLAAVVGGRTQLSLGEMRHRNLLLLFVHVMGLLELLQPHIFHSTHTSLAAVLQAFFSLFRAHGKEKRVLGSLLYKMVVFLQNFVTYDPQRASAMLQQYIQLLGDLSSVYPDMAELKSLLTGLTLPRQTQSDTAEEAGPSETAEPGSITLPTQGGGIPYAQVLMVLQRLQPDSPVDDLLAALREVDETSKRRVAVLQHFGSELKGLMTHVNDQCRAVTFSLILRYIHHCPRKASQFLSSFLNCLQHSNPRVVKSALANLAEFTVLCQDEASILLQKAFDVGVSTTIDTAPSISETLQLLNMESILYTKQPGATSG